MAQLTFLQKAEIKANIEALIDLHLSKGQIPMVVVSWNPADPSEVSSWRDLATDPAYVKHVLQFLIQTLE